MLLENEFLTINNYARAAQCGIRARQAILQWRKLFEIKTVEDFTKITRSHELKELKKLIESKAKNSKLLKDDLIFRRFLLLGGSVEKVCLKKCPMHIPH